VLPPRDFESRTSANSITPASTFSILPQYPKDYNSIFILDKDSVEVNT